MKIDPPVAGLVGFLLFLIVLLGVAVLSADDSSASEIPDSDCLIVTYEQKSLFGDDDIRKGVYCPEPVK